MKQVKFKELQQGMEIVVKGSIYGGAIYEVFEVEQGFCVIQAADGDLLALPEVMIATGDVGVYSVVEEEETPLQIAMRSMGLPPTFATPCSIEVCDCDGCVDGYDEEEEVTLVFTREEIFKAASVLGFVEQDKEIYSVMEKFEPYLDEEELNEGFDSVDLVVDSDLPLFEEAVSMQENYMNIQINY